jgi:hypothetical protein
LILQVRLGEIMSLRTIWIAVGIAVAVGVVRAEQAYSQTPDCDCTKVIGSCTASLSFNKKQSMATVRADTAECAKVTFDIDNTPYISVFRGGVSLEAVTVFDKSKTVSLSVRQCEVCEGDAGNGQDEHGSSAAHGFDGTWSDGESTYSMKSGTIYVDGAAYGTYSGRKGHTSVEHGGSPPATQCDLNLVDENHIHLVCYGGGAIGKWAFDATRTS